MYTIIEVANTHGGDIKYLNSLIDEFSFFNNDTGIKFQPFKYDKIALPDYEWYPVYERLFFNESEWRDVISKANETKDVWLDLFDLYGVQILKENLQSVFGLKLQTSVLNNNSVLNELKELDLSSKKLIINVAGRDFNKIEKFVDFFEGQIKPEELLIEVGFQAYPTDLIDSGISKIKAVKERFGKRVVFADHVEGGETNAKILPLVAFMLGADVIEKHVMHSSLETEFDHYSSIKLDGFKELVTMLNDYAPLLRQPFINTKEKEYLKGTLQMPVLNKDKKARDVISLNDIDYRRTESAGLTYSDFIEMINNGEVVLAVDKAKDQLFQKGDLSKVKTACIIAARLKSSRLKQKAKLKIGDVSSLELCIKNCLRFENVDATILATSTTEEDAELIDYKYDSSVVFHKGDPDDVIQRYLDIIRKEKIDVFIRVTGDMPYVSKDIASFLMAEHFKSGADYTVGNDAAVGTNLEIINSSALEKVKQYFTSANYSEYMTWYFQNNPEHFNLNFVDIPDNLVRDYRLTIDYQEDLDMFNKIEAYFKRNNIDYTIEKLFEYLDENSDIANMNSHISLKYKTDQSLIETLNRETKIK